MDPLALIRETTAYVSSLSTHVKINEQELVRECEDFLEKHKIKPHKEIWADNWFHYCDIDIEHESSTFTDLTAKYILVLDTLNFCFWPEEGLEYEHLARGLKNVLIANPKAFDADQLAKVTTETLHNWFGRELPNISERVRLVREVGTVLLAHFNGSIKEMILAAKNKASVLVDLITSYFWGFRDSAVYRGKQVFFYKRAQIFVGDLWGAYQGRGLGKFDDIKQLTMFADYRVPQILESLKVIEYSPELKKMIEQKQEIPYGSEMELEIRAVTVHCVERMRDYFNKHHCELLALEIDWMLWGRGEAMLDKLPPHHRTLTIFY
ncbi:hypothetical protein DICPUDRAFT_47225 [Dictyostelium purpureum]|uniref:Queuosine 5'-phosphate N-glycosylase/hydrolase n=1 Tax=Dictyostelium purpureum TaxID=5786 RepID=F0ZIE4_DICPU|nr:uncharacterized protein DICPUDRAFT_47225 [Dictyostelium purpureum]EGC36294.1 hypothetical protein DICPUDRAFT_47225 [Dictyostelium purpureum]|eukprot:XP_003287172.1 hypothetical protein DICPUDRAFT_47225 [Dictyostelium purpureum]